MHFSDRPRIISRIRGKIGTSKGASTRIADVGSRKHPIINSRVLTASRNEKALRSSVCIQAIIICGTFCVVNNQVSTPAADTITRIWAERIAESVEAWKISDHVIERYMKRAIMIEYRQA